MIVEFFRALPGVEAAQKHVAAFHRGDASLIGLTHQNMNIDNAFFWRDAAGKVESGFIDWGRFRQENYASALIHGFSCCGSKIFWFW